MAAFVDCIWDGLTSNVSPLFFAGDDMLNAREGSLKRQKFELN